MRTRSALAVLGAAALLGSAVGVIVLPDRDSASGPPTATAPTAAPSTPAPSSPDPSSPEPTTTGEPGSSPVRDDNLLTEQDFGAVGLSVTATRADSRLDLTGCVGSDRVDLTRRTLAEVAESGPPLQRIWQGENITASEQAIAARDAEEATGMAARIVRVLESCQIRPATYWVNGPTRTERLDAATTLSWLGSVDGSLNTSGRAPRNAPITGGQAVVRRGAQVAVIQLSLCAGEGDGGSCEEPPEQAATQLQTLARAAARRLG